MTLPIRLIVDIKGQFLSHDPLDTEIHPQSNASKMNFYSIFVERAKELRLPEPNSILMCIIMYKFMQTSRMDCYYSWQLPPNSKLLQASFYI